MSLKLSRLLRCAQHVAKRLSPASASLQRRSCPVIPGLILGSSRLAAHNSYRLSDTRWHSNSYASAAEQPSSAVEHAGHPPEVEPFLLTACPGCGALAQTIETGEAGYYFPRRRAVSSFLGRLTGRDEADEHEVVKQTLQQADPKLLESLGMSQTIADSQPSPPEHPLCDRCHDLIHHHVGAPIAHPSLDSLADIISESPHKYNHIYHVLDAADFPFSLVSKLHIALSTSAQRSKNRRSKHFKFIAGKITEVTFVITRSDLLAPKKEQVDRLMPYLVEVLRDALGSAGRSVRLGNVCCVSAKRGWWVKELKADIWERGGGGWMVGKVNVGKSNLFEVAFPKGKAEDISFDAVRSKARRSGGQQERLDRAEDSKVLAELGQSQQDREENEDSLLPPARLETPYPVMPTISSLPGTTASPIRIPFGNGRGELIDLPGLARGNLDTFVVPDQRDSLLMKSRHTPDQYVIKPGSSLLLGGLIRITSCDPDVVILAYPFRNLSPHLTSTDKAAAIQTGSATSAVRGVVATEAAQKSTASAGTFRLQWDVTKQRAGPLTAASAGGMKPRNLPFVVLSADILVEGVGWVELVAQVRKRKEDVAAEEEALGMSKARGRSPRERERDRERERPTTHPTHFPEVEIFSPEGRFVAVRRPMNAFVLGGLQSKPGRRAQAGRPRKSMKSAKGSGARRSDGSGHKNGE